MRRIFAALSINITCSFSAPIRADVNKTRGSILNDHNPPKWVSFACRFTLFPKTKENSDSISIDLANEHLSAEDARTLINRFLSLLSWCDDKPAILQGGWSGNPVPVPVPRRDLSSTIAWHWYFNRTLPEDEDLLQRLAYFREGLNAREAGIVSCEVLSFFKVFENRNRVQRGEENLTKGWISKYFPHACVSLNPKMLEQFNVDRHSKSVEKYIYECLTSAPLGQI